MRGGRLDLTNAKINGTLDMVGSTFEGSIDAGGLEVGRDLLMVSSTFEGDIVGHGLQVGGHLLLNGATCTGAATFTGSRINGHLALTGAKLLAGLDLSGTRVSGDLLLASEVHEPPLWGKDARLVLRNTRVGALQDSPSAWPSGKASLDLLGFVYEQLGGFAGGGKDAMLRRPVNSYISWLKKDPNFTRQPYQQLAAVFRASGDPVRANAILFASRDRERMEAWREGRYLQATGLWLLKLTIGYGLGRAFFRVLVGALVMTTVGTCVLWYSPKAQANGLLWRFFASLDQLLPIVELNREFSEFFNDPKRERLTTFQIAYFAFHSVVGFILSSFVIAGLAGLTQARRVDRP